MLKASETINKHRPIPKRCVREEEAETLDAMSPMSPYEAGTAAHPLVCM